MSQIYGSGTAPHRVSAGIDCDGGAVLKIISSDTALANPAFEQKRGTTKETFVTAYDAAAFKVYELLQEAF